MMVTNQDTGTDGRKNAPNPRPRLGQASRLFPPPQEPCPEGRMKNAKCRIRTNAFWSAPAEHSENGAFPRARQSGVALRLPPQSKAAAPSLVTRPSSPAVCLEDWNLEFLWSLEPGIWSFIPFPPPNRRSWNQSQSRSVKVNQTKILSWRPKRHARGPHAPRVPSWTPSSNTPPARHRAAGRAKMKTSLPLSLQPSGTSHKHAITKFTAPLYT